MIGLLAVGAVVLIPVTIVAALLALFAGVIGSIAERDLGVGLFAERDA
jgi:hypothetical protein